MMFTEYYSVSALLNFIFNIIFVTDKLKIDIIHKLFLTGNCRRNANYGGRCSERS